MFLRGRKLNISLVFNSQSYFKVPKTITLNVTHYFIMKIPKKTELKQVASNLSSHINFKNFINLYKDYTKEPYSFLVSNTTLLADNPIIKMSISEKLKLKQSITKSSKRKLNTIKTDKLLRFLLYQQEMLVNMSFDSQRSFTRKRLARKICCIENT